MLGIDPGTRIVGYAVVDVGARGELEYVECGVLRATPGAAVWRRIHELVGGLSQLVDELAPRHAALETAFHGRNSASVLKLAEARGALRQVCAHAGLDVSEYPPATVKRVVVGRGRATKSEVQARVSLLCRLRRAPAADAADALAIAICHAQTLGPTLGSARRGTS